MKTKNMTVEPTSKTLKACDGTKWAYDQNKEQTQSDFFFFQDETMGVTKK